MVTFHPKNDKLGLVSVMVSHGVVQHDVLFGQLQQHGIVKELADTDVLAQTLQSKQRSHHTCSNTRLHDTTEGGKKADLAPSGLDHELSGQVGGRLWLQRSDHDAFIQRVTRNDLKEDTYSCTMQETGECFLVQDNLDHVMIHVHLIKELQFKSCFYEYRFKSNFNRILREGC